MSGCPHGRATWRICPHCNWWGTYLPLFALLTACGAGEYQAALQTSADALRTSEPYLQTACDLAAAPAADEGVVLRCEEMTKAWDALFRAYERAHQCTGVPHELATGLDRFTAVFEGHDRPGGGPTTPVPDSAPAD